MSTFEEALADARRGHRITEWEDVAARLAAAAEAEVKRLWQRSARLVDVDLRELKDDYLALQRDYETATAEVEHLRAAWKRADEDANAAHAEVERLEAQIAHDALSQPEPEYSIRMTRTRYVSDRRFDTLEEAQDWMDTYLDESRWNIIRRVKPQPTEWEDVQ